MIAEQIPECLPGIDWPTFQARLGGPIKSWLPLEPSFPEALDILGHNRLLEGVEGRPDELFEEYVHVALQFLLTTRVIRYGQGRRGEAVPDGAALERDGLISLYDAKAYENGYSVTLDSVRQFSSYVKKFNKKYELYIGRVHSFLLVSGQFVEGRRSLQEKSDQMYSECGTRLTYLAAHDLGAATRLLAAQPAFRSSINWKQIFSRTFVTVDDVEKSLKAAQKDQVIHKG